MIDWSRNGNRNPIYINNARQRNGNVRRITIQCDGAAKRGVFKWTSFVVA